MDDDNTLAGAMGASDTITLNSTSIPALTSADLDRLTQQISINSNNYSISGSGGTYSMPQYGNITIGTGSGSNGSWGASTAYTTNTPFGVGKGLIVSGDAAFEGDIKWKGRSLGKMLEAIEDRLAILTPDPKKLEKYESLQKAYNHYKLMEKLIGED